jgi:hypothetical protein
MRALIMAGGADEKWTNLGGEGRRHFQVVCGERVIDRIVRQLRERGVDDIGIICPEVPGYDIEGTYRIEPTYDAWGHEGLNGRAYWSESDRTLMVYGDTIFSDRAMDVIVGFKRPTFQMFGRIFAKLVYGKGAVKGGGGELFAFSFWPDQADEWAAAVEMSFELRDAGIIKRGGSWEGYRIMGGARGPLVGKHLLYPRCFTRIHDGMTDDFDKPEQFVMLRALFEGLHNPARSA